MIKIAMFPSSRYLVNENARTLEAQIYFFAVMDGFPPIGPVA